MADFMAAEANPVGRIGVAESGRRDDGTEFARAAFSDWKTPNGSGALFFADANNSKANGANASVGFLKQERAGVEGFQVSHNVLTAGIENNGGLMARLTAYDGTLHAGPVDINGGVGFDTGFSFKDGVEAKIGGIGGKLSDKEIQACFIACVGVKWG